MILPPETIKRIRQGKQHQVRLPSHGRMTSPYVPGKAYAVQPGPGQKAQLRVTVLDAERSVGSETTLEEARREGHRTTTGHENEWTARYGNYDQHVFVLKIIVGDLEDKSRFMARRPSASGGDYTSNPARALDKDAEVIPEHDQARYTAQAHERDKARLHVLRAEMPLADRVQELERRASQGDQQAKRHLHVIGQRVQAAETRSAREAA